MFTSFSTALSALNANATAVDVVGNNLANLNTTGFKTNVVSFFDLVTQSLGAGLGETQVGFGVGRPLTSRQFTQGAIQASTGALDAAIQGDGFFVLRDARNGLVFSRAGNFQVDKDGNLLTVTGKRVQGWTDASGTVDTNSPIGDITIPVGALQAPSPTASFSLDLNLDASTAVGGTYSAPMPVIDSLGNSHVLTITFTRQTPTAGPPATSSWTYDVTIPGNDTGQATNDPVSVLTGTPGTVTFSDTGIMTAPDAATPVAIQINGLSDGAAPMNITWSLYTDSGAPRITQYSQQSAVSANAQDGAPPAELVRVGLADGGRILAQYSNGQQRLVGQLALAAIRNPESLIAVGENCFQANDRTALPAIGVPDSGGRGKIIGGAIEFSTVDIAREFTNLIVLQRAYQANAKVITTVDELSQETINLKR